MDDSYSDRWATAMGRGKKASRLKPSVSEPVRAMSLPGATLSAPTQTEVVLSVAKMSMAPSQHMGRDGFDLRVFSTKGHVTRFRLCPEGPLATAMLADIQAAVEAAAQAEGDWLEVEPKR
jgi:hypothetical protein